MRHSPYPHCLQRVLWTAGPPYSWDVHPATFRDLCASGQPLRTAECRRRGLSQEHEHLDNMKRQTWWQDELKSMIYSTTDETVFKADSLGWTLFATKIIFTHRFNLTSEYSGKLRTRSIPWLQMPWLLASPGHQLPGYWLCNVEITLVLKEWISTSCHVAMSRNIFVFSI